MIPVRLHTFIAAGVLCLLQTVFGLCPDAQAQSGGRAFALMQEGRRLLEAGRYEESAIRFRQLAEQYPQHPNRQEALVTLGNIQALYLHNPDAALQTYQEVIAHYFPESPWVQQAMLNQARAYITLQMLDQALQTLKRIPAVSSHYAQAQKILKTLAVSGVQTSWWRNRSMLFLGITMLELIYLGIGYFVGKSHLKSRAFWASFAVLLTLLCCKAFLNYQLFLLVRG